MKMQSLVTLIVTEKEIKKGLVYLLDGRRNNLKFSDPEYDRLSKLIEHIENNHSFLEHDKDDKYTLCVDGVVFEEDVDVS